MQPDEGFADGDREALVHGEIFAAPVDGGAQALHLSKNGAAVVLAPLPYALDKGFSAHLLPGGALRNNLPLHQHLRGDAGMIGAWNPKNRAAQHTAPANEDVALS